MLGFTKQEQGVVLFLLITLLIGASSRIYRSVFDKQEVVTVDTTFTQAFIDRAWEIHSQNTHLSMDSVATVAHVADSVVDRAGRRHVNLNKATLDELRAIPHIGPVLAGRIIAYRKHSGGFTKLEELRSVKGIGKGIFNKIVPYLTLE